MEWVSMAEQLHPSHTSASAMHSVGAHVLVPNKACSKINNSFHPQTDYMRSVWQPHHPLTWQGEVMFALQ